MSGAAILRSLWQDGVLVRRKEDGTLVLVPAELVTPQLVGFAAAYRDEIAEQVAQLPAPGRCSICGDVNGWQTIPNAPAINCVICSTIGLERELKALGIESQPLDRIA